MAGADVLLAVGLVGLAFLAAFAGLSVSAALSGNRQADRGLFDSADEPSVFVFAGDALLDATAQARQILAAAPREGSDWARLSRLLTPRLPDLAEARELAMTEGRTTILSRDGATRVVLEPNGDSLRLSILSVETADATVLVDRLSLAASRRELEGLRAISEGVPWLVWRDGPANPNGTRPITWANTAYLDRATEVTGQSESWPPPHIFETDPARDGFGDPRRLAIKHSSKAPSDWYVIYAQPLSDGVLYSAVTAAQEVASDAALRAFRQTLTQTFASLSAGLAIFDQNRVLTLFNTALTETLNLPVSFAASKPTLFAFLDRLRADRRIPEPRNYKGWRADLAALEGNASGPGYGETWTLSDGQVLRVTGRPHGDGAFALIFEDITSEIALTRQFRAELDLSQAVIDSMDEALAIFDASGVLAISNEAYATLWDSDPRTTLGDLTLPEATQRWTSRTAATPAWQALQAFVRQTEAREGWTRPVRMTDGRGLNVRVAPLAGGATLVGFRTDAADTQRPVNITRLAKRAAGASG